MASGTTRRSHTYPKAVDDQHDPNQPENDENPQPDGGNGYDPDEFLIGVQDGNGHSVKVWARCNPGYASAAEAIVQSKVFPYRTMSDLIRHGFIRHIKWLKALEPDKVSDLYHLSVIDLLNAEEQKMVEFRTSIDRTTKILTDLRAAKQFGRARILLAQVLHEISQMKSDWRTHYMEALQPYMGMLDEAAAVNLRPGPEGEDGH